jgi:Membrane proteins related to metalloendopeptidases
MERLKKGLVGLVFLCVVIGITTCSTTQPITVSNTKNSFPIQYPNLAIAAPPTAALVPFPAPELEVYQADKKPVTTRFTSFDNQHVRSKDPLLFSSGNTILIDFSEIGNEAYAFPLPGGKIISPYGGRRRHSGVDIKTRANDTIVSAFEGIVRMAAPYAAYGNVIVVRHYNGLETVYSHNSRNLVKAGDEVKAGQSIALTGRTGRATTEHLHFEVRINGEHVNPAIFFDLKNRDLYKKIFSCARKGEKITVTVVDPFPYQHNYLSYYY